MMTSSFVTFWLGVGIASLAHWWLRRPLQKKAWEQGKAAGWELAVRLENEAKDRRKGFTVSRTPIAPTGADPTTSKLTEIFGKGPAA